MYRSRLFLFLAAGLLAAFTTAPAEAREDGAATESEAQSSSSLAGTVVDSTGGAIRGARITARQDGELVGETRSAGDGSYTLPLAPGEYLVEVQASGFDLAARTVRVDSGAETLDFELELTGLAESVSVTARAEGYVAGNRNDGDEARSFPHRGAAIDFRGSSGHH